MDHGAWVSSRLFSVWKITLKSAITVSLGSKEDLKQLNIEGTGQCLRVLFAISNDAFITSSIRKCQVIGYQKKVTLVIW